MKKQTKPQIEILTRPGPGFHTHEVRVCGVVIQGVEGWDLEEQVGNFGRLTIRICAPVSMRMVPNKAGKPKKPKRHA